MVFLLKVRVDNVQGKNNQNEKRKGSGRSFTILKGILEKCFGSFHQFIQNKLSLIL